MVPRVAVKPRVTEPAAGMFAVYEAAVTVTSAPDWVAVPPHRWETRWPSGKAQRRVQPLTAAEPVLRRTISPWKPPDHSPVTR